MKKNSTIIFFVIKLAVVLLAYYFLINRLKSFGDLKTILAQIDLGSNFMLYASSIIFLFFINWYLVTYIWKLFVAPWEKISLKKSLHSVLLGTVGGSVTPGKVGVWPGKMLVFGENLRIKIVIVAILTSAFEIVALFIPGFLALSQFLNNNILLDNFSFAIPLSIAIIVELMLIFLILSLPKYGGWIARSNLPNKWKEHLLIFTSYSWSKLLQLLSLSVLRTLVYFAQFYFMLQLFNVPITLADGILLIPSYYFILSYIPGFILTDMGVRGAISVLIIGAIYPQHPAIALAAMALWGINVGLPIAIGSIALLKHKNR